MCVKTKKEKSMDKKPVVCGIVAVGPYNIIGRADSMPWHSKHDMAFFKQTTMGHPCIFGKNTYNNLQFKPLPGRLNIVCSSSYKTERQGNVLYVPSLEEALKQCGNVERVFVCGGAVLYDYALTHDLIDIFYLTRINILDEKQKQKFQQDSKLNTYFPYAKMNCRKWLWESTMYNYNNPSLPPENPGIKAAFFKYTRYR
jgi:dihydrofolate reductase